MELTPYLDGLRQDLGAVAAAGGPDTARAGELLAGAITASARLCLLEALSEAAAEITTKLRAASVDVRLRGGQAQFVVTEEAPEPVTAAPAPPEGDTGDIARITLRLPEHLKEAVERAAVAEGISVNSFLVRAITATVYPPKAARSPFEPPDAGFGMPFPPPPPPPPMPPTPPGRRVSGRRLTGFAEA
jgi:hypothetical protein